ncbi:MAG: hypothetical protein ACYCX3_05310 [Thermoleophilia bacterium]
MLPHFDHLVVSVSATTRPRRAGEGEGREYYFLSRREFLRRVEAREFLEWMRGPMSSWRSSCRGRDR